MTPSPIQLASLPTTCDLGLDCLIQAKSGTGKTLAYVLPALKCLLDAGLTHSSSPSSGAGVLVVCPTREIAVQGARVAMDIGCKIKDLKVLH